MPRAGHVNGLGISCADVLFRSNDPTRRPIIEAGASSRLFTFRTLWPIAIPAISKTNDRC